MKHLRKGLSLFAALSLTLSVAAAAMAPGAAAAAAKNFRAAARVTVEPNTEYPLKSYKDAVKAVYDAGVAADPDAAQIDIPAALDSQWRAEIKPKDGSWISGDRVWMDVNYMCIRWTNEQAMWAGSNFPVAQMYVGEETGRTELTKLMPCKSNVADFIDPTCYDFHMAWAFTAPAAGVYTFNHTPDDDVVAFGECLYFTTYGPNKAAARITIDGEAVWPTAADATAGGFSLTEDGWAEFSQANVGPDGQAGTEDDYSGVPIPKLDDLEMASGQVLRVETKDLTPLTTSEPWNRKVTASAHMTYKSEPLPDETAPAFPESAVITNNAAAATDTTLSLSWPAASDDKTATNSIAYKVFVSDEAITDITGLTGTEAPDKTSLTLTGLTGSTAYYVAVAAYDLAGNYGLLTAGPFTTKAPPPAVVASYAMYDYFDDVRTLVGTSADDKELAGVTTESPWRALLFNDNKWTAATLAHYDSADETIYLKTPAVEWGGNFPSVHFSTPKDGSDSQWCELIPSHSNGKKSYQPDGWQANVAMQFTAPKAGIYTFRHSDDATSGDKDITQHFLSRGVKESGGVAQEFGVRIVKGNETIWPKAADAEAGGFTIKDGWALIPGDATNKNNWVKVPTITGLELKAGETLRVESTSLTKADWPWDTKVSACVTMDLNAEKGADTTAPTFGSGEVELDSATTSMLTVTWPAATDDQTVSSAIVYTVYTGTAAFTEDTLPTTGGTAVTGETVMSIADLEAGTAYYIAVVAKDPSGNTSLLTGGPFSTKAEGGGEPGGDDNPGGDDGELITDPTAPLEANMGENSAGIISSAADKIQIGWNAASGISIYRAYLFVKTGSGYTLEHASDSLGYSANTYTFENLGEKAYILQVVGYNVQGDPIAIYPQIAVDLSDIGGGTNPGDDDDPGNGGSTHKPDDSGSTVPKTGETFAISAILLAAVSGGVLLFRNRKERQNMVK